MANPAPLTSVEGGLAHGKMHETWRMALAEQVDSIWSMKEVRECETEVTSQGSTMDVYNDTPQVASGNGRNGMEAITQLCDTERATGRVRNFVC